MSMRERLPRVEAVARQRVEEMRLEIKQTLSHVSQGNPLAAERNPERLVARMMAKNGMTREEAEATCMGIRTFAELPQQKKQEVMRDRGKMGGPEAIWGRSIDFVGVAFLERGRNAARAVARVAIKDSRAGLGSGFMVTDRLFLTNNHVIATAAEAAGLCAEFEYEIGLRDNVLGETRFAFDPSVFVTDRIEDLDFTLIAIADRVDGAKALPDFGFCPLSDAPDKHAIGEVVNIVQHPQGRYKEVVLRENRLVARATEALHYMADTEPGSSGSPVFNNQWQAIALHHWGGPYRNRTDSGGMRVPEEVNEGIRVSAIVAKLRAKVPSLSGKTRVAVEDALAMWDTAAPMTEAAPLTPTPVNAPSRGPRRNDDGSVTWSFPIELTVRAPLFDTAPASAMPPLTTAPQPRHSTTKVAERKIAPDADYSDRSGYEPGFIEGHVVPLPKLGANLKDDAARNKQARRGDNPHELKYHHFSAVVNAQRRLAFFTACNIDGRSAKFVNRDTGDVVALDPSNKDHGLREALLAEGAEASETWYEDERIGEDEIAMQATYDKQDVPGFPTSTKMKRTLRMFQRGHLVRRLDPAWGTKAQALAAEADTFHFTNCAPQVGFFNMGQARAEPGTGGGKLWRAVENIVLRNARNTRSRVSSFTGPIFAANDRKFRGIRVPARFFKIAVWADDDGLRSLAMIADQSKVFGPWPEALFSGSGAERMELGAERFQDTDELERVEDFLSTIVEIEAATGLDFGNEVRRGDVNKGERRRKLDSLDEVPLSPKSHPTRPKRAAKRKVAKRA